MIDTHRNWYDKKCKCLFWTTGKTTYNPTENTLHDPTCPSHPLVPIVGCNCKVERFRVVDALDNLIIYTKIDNSDCLIHEGNTELLQEDDDKVIWTEKLGRYWRAKL